MAPESKEDACGDYDAIGASSTASAARTSGSLRIPPITLVIDMADEALGPFRFQGYLTAEEAFQVAAADDGCDGGRADDGVEQDLPF